MLIDLAGSEGPTLNSSHAAVAQGVAVNKSLHWLRVAVHALTAGRPARYRSSALTRLLQPLGGHAVVAVLVTSSVRPPANTARDTLDALQFGEAVAKLKVAPQRRTEAAAGGQLEKMQALLIQLNDDRAAMASDSNELREQLADYSALIDEYRAGFVKREEAEEERKAMGARNAELQAELAREVDEKRALEARLRDEEAVKEEVAAESRRLEAEVAASRKANAALKQKVEEEAAEVAAAKARVDGYEAALAKEKEEADARGNTALRAELAREVGRTRPGGAARRRDGGSGGGGGRIEAARGEVAAAAAANAALAAEAKEVALAKDSLVLLKVKNKMYAKGGSRPGSRGSLKRLAVGSR